MANIVESKVGRVSADKKASKVCLKCSNSRPVTDFYTNRDWVEQLGRDAWCKQCVNRCATKDEIREYFWENHREWDERIWELAKDKALRLANVNPTYVSAPPPRQEKILERLTCQQVPVAMVSRYKYVNHGEDGKSISYKEAKENGEIKDEEIDENVKTWSKEFNGWFKKHELEYLNDYYEGLERDFDLNDTNLRDIAKKLAKASLQADKAQDDFMAGKCDYSVVKDAIAQFDLLSKSGNFAACKRKPGDQGGMGSWSELTYLLETTGHPCTRKIEWEPDDVDKTISEFRYIVEALGLDAN